MSVQLETMTMAEKRELYSQLAYDLAPKKAKAELSSSEQDFWTALNDALGIHGAPRAVGPFIAQVGAQVFKDAAASVESFVTEGCSEGLRKPMRAAVTQIVLECLVAHLAVRNIPQTHGVMLKSLQMLPYAVDQRFPGYAAVRFLDRVVPASTIA